MAKAKNRKTVNKSKHHQTGNKPKEGATRTGEEGAAENGAAGDHTDVDVLSTYGPQVVGLTNLGNTCFLNSALQALLGCPPLQRHYGAGSTGVPPGPLGFALHQAFLHTSRPVSGKNRRVYNPQALYSAICLYAPQFKGKQQQDSHEFLRYLLDGLQTEGKKLKDLVRRSPSKSSALRMPSPSEEGQPEQNGEHLEPDACQLVEPVSRVFGGELCSTVVCTNCGHSSSSREPFLDLSLPIPFPLARSDNEREGPAGTSGSLDATHPRGKKHKGAKKHHQARQSQAPGKDEEAEAHTTMQKANATNARKGAKRNKKKGRGGVVQQEERQEAILEGVNANPAEEPSPEETAEVMESCQAEPSSGVGGADSGTKASGSLYGCSALPVAASTEPLSVMHCLEAFFSREGVTWECAKEKEQWKMWSSRDTEDDGCPIRKQVSWSDSGPQVILVPGSVEQRGTPLEKAMQGRVPFTRPVRVADPQGGVQHLAYLVAVTVDSESVGLLHVKLTANNCREAERQLPPGGLSLVDVTLPGEIRRLGLQDDVLVEEEEELAGGDDGGVEICYPHQRREAYQQAVSDVALHLLSFVADTLISCGLQKLVEMVGKGVQLVREGGDWKLRGSFSTPLGLWLYPYESASDEEACGVPKVIEDGEQRESRAREVFEMDDDVESRETRLGVEHDVLANGFPSSTMDPPGTKAVGDACVAQNGSVADEDSCPGLPDTHPAAAPSYLSTVMSRNSWLHVEDVNPQCHQHYHIHQVTTSPSSSSTEEEERETRQMLGGLPPMNGHLPAAVSSHRDTNGFPAGQGISVNGSLKVPAAEALSCGASWVPIPSIRPHTGSGHVCSPATREEGVDWDEVNSRRQAAASVMGSPHDQVSSPDVGGVLGALRRPPSYLSFALQQDSTGKANGSMEGLLKSESLGSSLTQVASDGGSQGSGGQLGPDTNSKTTPFQCPASGPPVSPSQPERMLSQAASSLSTTASLPMQIHREHSYGPPGCSPIPSTTPCLVGTPGTTAVRQSSLSKRNFQRPALKSYRVQVAPEALMLHLKRFHQDPKGKLKKFDGHVGFPLLLDLSPFLVEGVSVPPYELHAVVVHSGNMRGGHYVAYVKRVFDNSGPGQGDQDQVLKPASDEAAAENLQATEHTPEEVKFHHGLDDGSGDHGDGGGYHQWYYCSDTNIRPCDVNEVLQCQAFLLMYVQSGRQPQSKEG